MKRKTRIFAIQNSSHGSMLVELLLSIALAILIIPFIFDYQQKSVVRAQNIQIANQMAEIQVALERYIIANRTELLRPIGSNITRIDIVDLAPYGIPVAIQEHGDDKYQIRILKSSDASGQSTLQGVIIRQSDDISPLRTREIVNLSGGSMGFVDGTHAYGTFGAWHTDRIDIDTDLSNGIIETTSVNRENALYLWRLPSDDVSDAQMLSPLNLGGHDIKNAKYLNANFAEFSELLSANTVVSNNTIFQNRTTIDKTFHATAATVSGILSSDSKNLEISGGLSLADTAKLSSLTAQNLWVSNLTLGGLSIDATDDLSVLKVNQALDMTSGRVDAIFVTVGFAGSMTPRLVVTDRIEDSINSSYYWDVSGKSAYLADASFVELGRMATLASIDESIPTTHAGQIFSAVVANKNATVSDYMNAIREIQRRVQEKYRLLKL